MILTAPHAGPHPRPETMHFTKFSGDQGVAYQSTRTGHDTLAMMTVHELSEQGWLCQHCDLFNALYHQALTLINVSCPVRGCARGHRLGRESAVSVTRCRVRHRTHDASYDVPSNHDRSRIETAGSNKVHINFRNHWSQIIIILFVNSILLLSHITGATHSFKQLYQTPYI